MTDEPETNEHGNRIERSFLAGADRYLFDFQECRAEDGWVQFDTDEDASYFGVWVHPQRRQTVTFAEGDVTQVSCSTEASYRAEIEALCEFYDTTPAFKTISDDGTITEYYQDRGEFLDGPGGPGEPG